MDFLEFATNCVYFRPMAFSSLVIQIFVSSPSDVADDRSTVIQEMSAWNQRNARDKGCFLVPVTWEDAVAPDMAEYSQDVVNTEIGDDYDVFLGLMWSRFGTPTALADSGTEEEFNRAVQRRSSGDALRISFLFKNADIPYEKIDPEQIIKIKEFKKAAAKNGLYYRQYADQAELITSLRLIFDKIGKEKNRYFDINNDKSDGKQGYSEDSGLETEGDGLFDYEDRIQAAMTVFNNDMQDWGAKFVEINGVVSEATAKIASESQFGAPDRPAIRRAVDSVTAALAGFEEFGKERIGSIEDSLEDIIVSLSGIIEISNGSKPSNHNEDIEQLAELKKIITLTSVQMQSYIKALSGIPRIDRNFAKARDGVVLIHKRLLKKINDFSNRLDRLLSE